MLWPQSSEWIWVVEFLQWDGCGKGSSAIVNGIAGIIVFGWLCSIVCFRSSVDGEQRFSGGGRMSLYGRSGRQVFDLRARELHGPHL
jgi:hypothetical protein